MPPKSESALVAAVKFNRADIADILLKRGARVDPEEADDRSALQVAAMIGRASLVKLLIANGADVNHMDHDGNPPLLMAVMRAMVENIPPWLLGSYLEIGDDDIKGIGNEHLESARLLIQAGAKVNGPATEDGTTSLMSAAMSGDVEMTKLLLIVTQIQTRTTKTAGLR
jgi:ankyrin repeat protein